MNVTGMLPTSGRFLFYELVQAGVVSKVHTGARRPDQNLLDALTHLREAGLVPWDWIVDETRELTWYRTAPQRGRIRARRGRLRFPRPLGGRACTADPVRITFTGRGIGEYRRAVRVPDSIHQRPVPRVPDLEGGTGTGARPAGALLGDWDWCGHQIEEHSRRTLLEHSDIRPARRLRRAPLASGEGWERVALTAEQVRENDLPGDQQAGHAATSRSASSTRSRRRRSARRNRGGGARPARRADARTDRRRTRTQAAQRAEVAEQLRGLR